jgi:hypothetical protein
VARENVNGEWSMVNRVVLAHRIISRKGAKKMRRAAKTLFCPFMGYMFVAKPYLEGNNAP